MVRGSGARDRGKIKQLPIRISANQSTGRGRNPAVTTALALLTHLRWVNDPSLVSNHKGDCHEEARSRTCHCRLQRRRSLRSSSGRFARQEEKGRSWHVRHDDVFRQEVEVLQEQGLISARALEFRGLEPERFRPVFRRSA